MGETNQQTIKTKNTLKELESFLALKECNSEALNSAEGKKKKKGLIKRGFLKVFGNKKHRQ